MLQQEPGNNHLPLVGRLVCKGNRCGEPSTYAQAATTAHNKAKQAKYSVGHETCFCPNSIVHTVDIKMLRVYEIRDQHNIHWKQRTILHNQFLCLFNVFKWLHCLATSHSAFCRTRKAAHVHTNHVRDTKRSSGSTRDVTSKA